MKRLLQLGFLLGLVGTLTAAYFAPWFEYPRLRSATTVAPNGGRLEQFEVRLPVDRIGAGLEVPSQPDAGGLEHFKLRDTQGNVIGIAARHSLAVADGLATAWLLTIPSRGTIAFAASPGGSLESELQSRGLAPGQSSEPELSLDLGMPAKSVATTGEFADLDLELVETWLVSGRETDGSVRGTLRLSTVGQMREEI